MLSIQIQYLEAMKCIRAFVRSATVETDEGETERCCCCLFEWWLEAAEVAVAAASSSAAGVVTMVGLLAREAVAGRRSSAKKCYTLLTLAISQSIAGKRLGRLYSPPKEKCTRISDRALIKLLLMH